MYVIEAEKLTKKYMPSKGIKALVLKSPLKEEITAVYDANLQVKKGEVFGFLGPNGAGKTTLIKMLTTLVRPTSGKAYVNGYDVVKEDDKARTSIGLVTGEERNFYWRLTGRQNLEFFATLYGLSSLDSKKRIDAVLEQLELKDAADNMFYGYSSGMKQKLTLARSLISNPEVLFLDEPTKSVDVMTGRDLKSFIKKNLVEKEGRTIFLTTHRLEEAEALCSRLAIINHGRIVFCGTIEELRQKIHTKDKFSLLIKGLGKDRVQQICSHPSLEGLDVEEYADSQTKINFIAGNGQNPLSYVVENILKNGATLTSVNKIEPNLEDLFTDFLKRDPLPTKEKTSVVS